MTLENSSRLKLTEPEEKTVNFQPDLLPVSPHMSGNAAQRRGQDFFLMTAQKNGDIGLSEWRAGSLVPDTCA